MLQVMISRCNRETAGLPLGTSRQLSLFISSFSTYPRNLGSEARKIRPQSEKERLNHVRKGEDLKMRSMRRSASWKVLPGTFCGREGDCLELRRQVVACAWLLTVLDGVHGRLVTQSAGEKWKSKRTLDGLVCCDSSGAGVGNWAIG